VWPSVRLLGCLVCCRWPAAGRRHAGDSLPALLPALIALPRVPVGRQRIDGSCRGVPSGRGWGGCRHRDCGRSRRGGRCGMCEKIAQGELVRGSLCARMRGGCRHQAGERLRWARRCRAWGGMGATVFRPHSQALSKLIGIRPILYSHTDRQPTCFFVWEMKCTRPEWVSGLVSVSTCAVQNSYLSISGLPVHLGRGLVCERQ
jgi:hypothetical protein